MDTYIKNGVKKPADADLINKVPRAMDDVKKGFLKDGSDALVKKYQEREDKRKGFY